MAIGGIRTCAILCALAGFAWVGCSAGSSVGKPAGDAQDGGDSGGAGVNTDGTIASVDGSSNGTVTDGSVSGSGGLLEVRILEAGGKQVAARVNVMGSNNAYYEPAQADNSLYAYSLKRFGFRKDRGPARYWGSFFYTDGKFQVRLPAG